MGRYKKEEESSHHLISNVTHHESKIVQGKVEIKRNQARERLHSKCPNRKECFHCLSSKSKECPGGLI